MYAHSTRQYARLTLLGDSFWEMTTFEVEAHGVNPPKNMDSALTMSFFCETEHLRDYLLDNQYMIGAIFDAIKASNDHAIGAPTVYPVEVWTYRPVCVLLEQVDEAGLVYPHIHEDDYTDHTRWYLTGNEENAYNVSGMAIPSLPYEALGLAVNGFVDMLEMILAVKN